MTLTLRYMTTADINQVAAIDSQSFDPPWSPHSYAYEINESKYSHMVTLETNQRQALQGWRRWLNDLTGNSNGYLIQRVVVGYGGMWRMMDEAHISTIATHPDWRGRGYGEILLAGMIQRGLTLNADKVVLEVRVSNTIAQNLYRKYDFEIVGVKENYYRSNNEDAYDMRLNLRDDGIRKRFAQRWTDLQARCPFADRYSDNS